MFKLTISPETKKDMELFGITEYPFTYAQLKTAYRDKLKSCHPDKCNKNAELEKKAESITKKVIITYKKLVLISVEAPQIEKKGAKSTGDIFEDKMMEPCVECNGSGRKFFPEETGSCRSCTDYSSYSFGFQQGHGYHIKTCGSCNGSGKFTQRNTKKVVTCLACKGVGRIKIKCKSCNGTGAITTPSYSIECSNCNGFGKIKIKVYNPVIPQSAVLI